MEISTLGFLEVKRFDNEAATRGAILITDIDTKPIEFRITAPVCPQNMQTILYGELLNEHIAVELIGLPLINAVNTKPDLILVRDDLLLNISNKQNIPTIRIMRSDEPAAKKELKTQTLNTSNPSYQSAKIYTNGKFTELLEEVAEKLQPFFSQRNLIEPFDRLERACIDAHNKKLGNK